MSIQSKYDAVKKKERKRNGPLIDTTVLYVCFVLFLQLCYEKYIDAHFHPLQTKKLNQNLWEWGLGSGNF